MFDITSKRLRFFMVSGVMILIGIIFLSIGGLQMGNEFKSGSQLRVSFDEQVVSQSDLRTALADMGYGNAVIQSEITASGQGDFLIRTGEISGAAKVQMVDDLGAKFGAVTELEFNNVSPEVATETGRNAIIAVAVASIGILLYVTWAFRRMPRPFRYGTCGIIALVHDVLVVVGVFAIFGFALDWQINVMFITGVLAVIGYSINNTVVIFDRIRENITRGVSNDFEVVVNFSIVETLGRSINTSLTTLIVAVALLLFVGTSILNFAVVLIIGILVGTYSSMFVAPLLLLAWEKRDWKKLAAKMAQRESGAI
jgi:preprotein translocase subunit SecF